MQCGEGQTSTSVELKYFFSLFYTAGIWYIKQCLYLTQTSISFYLFMFLIDTPIPHKDFTPQRV